MLSISQNVRLCVRVSVCLFTFEVLFKRLFAPTSQSQMSKIVRVSESEVLREVVSYLNIFAQKWSKFAAAKKVFIQIFFFIRLFFKYRFTSFCPHFKILDVQSS